MNDSATNTSTTHQNVYTTSASAFQMILPILRVSSKMKHCIHLSERKVLSFQFKPLPTRNITYTWQGKKKYTQILLHRAGFTQFYTQMSEAFTSRSLKFGSRDAFAHKTVSARKFTQRSRYTEHFCTKKSSCTEASTQSSRCTEQL